MRSKEPVCLFFGLLFTRITWKTSGTPSVAFSVSKRLQFQRTFGWDTNGFKYQLLSPQSPGDSVGNSGGAGMSSPHGEGCGSLSGLGLCFCSLATPQ